ncbi:2Fe-2S iron-sulfur cluster-binding protein [Bordetella genomosp. 1]|uniref:Ferredoxin n=1 Tax=Bordetella genomosp. 1 TaxID=1395607 RepID=A0ABX4F4N4_9BORD|nr:2Fe-2S iron-sulfur cluster-binding protein [Bordetella genomosp. 1]OZI68722.1 ferredoxin [Bordetella genomosp. 1]
MPTVVFHKGDTVLTDEVKDNTNLVVRAGIKQFPYPNLSYQCGMGKCATCACQVLKGAEHLPPPNWKEKKQLGERIEQGWRLACQLWITHDIELAQPAQAAGTALGGNTLGATSIGGTAETAGCS